MSSRLSFISSTTKIVALSKLYSTNLVESSKTSSEYLTSFKEKLKVLPLPSSLSTLRAPPSLCASFSLIAKPKPVPPYLRLLCPSCCSKLLKIFS